MAEELEQADEYVDEAEEVVDSAGEGQETATEEPEEVVGDYSPDWLNESQDEPQQPQYSPEEIAAYQQQVAQQYGYGQRQGPQSQQPQESDLDRLVKDTRGTIASIAQEQAYNIAQHMMQRQFGPYAQQMQQFMENQTRAKVAETDRAVKKMYDNVFNKDEAFVGNKAVREQVTQTLKNLRHQAVHSARMGDPSMLNMFEEPAFADIALYAAKKVAGMNPSASSPMSSPRTERTAPASKEKKSYTNELDPDTIEGLKRLYGSNWESRYAKAREQEDKYKDFS
jgi:hypothetical protein